MYNIEWRLIKDTLYIWDLNAQQGSYLMFLLRNKPTLPESYSPNRVFFNFPEPMESIKQFIPTNAHPLITTNKRMNYYHEPVIGPAQELLPIVAVSRSYYNGLVTDPNGFIVLAASNNTIYAYNPNVINPHKINTFNHLRPFLEKNEIVESIHKVDEIFVIITNSGRVFLLKKISDLPMNISINEIKLASTFAKQLFIYDKDNIGCLTNENQILLIKNSHTQPLGYEINTLELDIRLEKDEAITKIASYYRHERPCVVFLTSHNRLFAYGNNQHGQLGLSDTEDKDKFMLVPQPNLLVGEKIQDIACFENMNVFLTSENRLFGAGKSILFGKNPAEVSIEQHHEFHPFHTAHLLKMVLRESETISHFGDTQKFSCLTKEGRLIFIAENMLDLDRLSVIEAFQFATPLTTESKSFHRVLEKSEESEKKVPLSNDNINDKLPHEILSMIFKTGGLTFNDYMNIAQTCRYWYNIVRTLKIMPLRPNFLIPTQFPLTPIFVQSIIDQAREFYERLPPDQKAKFKEAFLNSMPTNLRKSLTSTPILGQAVVRQTNYDKIHRARSVATEYLIK